MAGIDSIFGGYTYTPTVHEAMALPETSSARFDIHRTRPQGFDRVSDFGPRFNAGTNSYPRTSLKGYGWMGLLPTEDGGVASEVSIPVQLEGRRAEESPSLVPTLSREEAEYVARSKMQPSRIPEVEALLRQNVLRKAAEWSGIRQLQGLSPFID